MRIGKIGLYLVLAALAVLFAAESGYNLFQKGLAKERAEADLRGAVRIYEQVVRENVKDHKLAAQALFRIGECQQALGDKEARKAYERLMRDYPDQNEIVAQAQARLTAMRGAPAPASGIITRQVWTGPDVQMFGSVSPDGRFVSYSDPGTKELALRDLSTGEVRLLTNEKGQAQNGADFSIISPDGKQVAYVWFKAARQWELRVLGLHGNAPTKPRVVYSNPEVRYPGPWAWSADGKWIGVQLQRLDMTVQVALVSPADGSNRVLKTLPWRGGGMMAFSPDGKYLAYEIPASAVDQRKDIMVIATDGSSEFPGVVDPNSDARPVAWTPDGKHLLFKSDRSGAPGLWAMPMSDGKPRGAPKLVKPVWPKYSKYLKWQGFVARRLPTSGASKKC